MLLLPLTFPFLTSFSLSVIESRLCTVQEPVHYSPATISWKSDERVSCYGFMEQWRYSAELRVYFRLRLSAACRQYDLSEGTTSASFHVKWTRPWSSWNVLLRVFFGQPLLDFYVFLRLVSISLSSVLEWTFCHDVWCNCLGCCLSTLCQTNTMMIMMKAEKIDVWLLTYCHDPRTSRLWRVAKLSNRQSLPPHHTASTSELAVGQRGG